MSLDQGQMPHWRDDAADALQDVERPLLHRLDADLLDQPLRSDTTTKSKTDANMKRSLRL